MADESPSLVGHLIATAVAPATLEEGAGGEHFRLAAPVSVDGRARAALELAALAVKHCAEGLEDGVALGRRLRAVADSFAEATRLYGGMLRAGEPA
jgi:hypothetical protein